MATVEGRDLLCGILGQRPRWLVLQLEAYHGSGTYSHQARRSPDGSREGHHLRREEGCYRGRLSFGREAAPNCHLVSSRWKEEPYRGHKPNRWQANRHLLAPVEKECCVSVVPSAAEGPQPCWLPHRSYQDLHRHLLSYCREERRNCITDTRRASSLQACRLPLGLSWRADQQATHVRPEPRAAISSRLSASPPCPSFLHLISTQNWLLSFL